MREIFSTARTDLVSISFESEFYPFKILPEDEERRGVED